MLTMKLLSRTAGVALLGAAAFAPNAATAQVMMPVAPQSQPVVLKGATIHTVTKGTIQNGTIVLENGKITAIGGADVPTPRAAKVVDLTGKHIYPGLIDAYSTVGSDQKISCVPLPWWTSKSTTATRDTPWLSCA